MIDAMRGIPPVRWADVWEGLPEAARRASEDNAMDSAQNTTRRAAYLAARNRGQGHAAAVKASNRAVTAVRRALGYSYPDKNTVNF